MIGSGGNVVDNKIVSLEFQNQNFETNTKKSLSTLEKLKKALEFKGISSKVFEGIGTAANAGATGAKNLTGAIGGINTALDTIKDVTAFTMINKAATDAYESVKRLAKSLTVDQIGAGWSKYADKTEKIQTIMSATAMNYDDEEKHLADVTAQIDKLNWFTDETSYKFVEMADNIGKFTSNQVELGTAVTAMQGISTWASKSGASVNEASRAMYNLSQAISVGSVKLMDWKSIENANMATAEFKQTAIDTAVAVGTLTKVSDGLWKTAKGSEVSVKNFNESLSDQWFSSDVLLKTLDKYGGFSDALQKFMEDTDYAISTKEMLEYIEEYKKGTIDIAKEADKADISVEVLKAGLETLSTDAMDFGREAFKAAQQTLTFEQAIGYVTESVSTGWMNTFEILFGDYLGAKSLWSDLSEYMYEVFVKGGEERNQLLEDAFDATNIASLDDWNTFSQSGLFNPQVAKNLRKTAEEHGFVCDVLTNDMAFIEAAVKAGTVSIGDFQEAVENLGISESKLSTEKSDEDLKKRLEEGGEEIQNYIADIKELNEKYSADDIMGIVFGNGAYEGENTELEETFDYLLQYLGMSQDEGEKLRDTLADMGVLTDNVTKSITEMSLAELMAVGYTKEQAVEIRRLAYDGKSVAEIMERIGLNTQTGADHWVNALHNLMDIIVNLKDVTSGVFSNYFDGIESSQIFELVKAFDEATEKVKAFIGTGEEPGNQTFLNVLDAIASAVDLVVGNIDILGKALAFKGIAIGIAQIGKFVGVIKKLALPVMAAAAAFEFIKGLISGLGLDWGQLANTVANLTKKFTTFMKAVDPLGKALDAVGKAGQYVGKRIRGFFDAFTRMEKVNRGVRQLQRGFKLFLGGFSDHMKEIPGRVDKFTQEVEKMGGVKPENFSEIFKLAEEEIGDFLMTFPGVKNFINGFKLLLSAVEEKLIGIGIPVDKIKAGIKGLIDVLGISLQMVGSFATGSISKVTELWNKFKELPTVKSAIDKFGNAFKVIGSTIGPFLEGFGAKWDSFKERVGNLEGGFSFKNAGEIFKIFKEEIIGYIKNWDGFKAIKDAFDDFWENIKKSLSENETFMSIYHGFIDIVNGLIEVFKDVKLPKSLDDLPEFFASISEAIEGMPTAEGGGVKNAIWNGIKYVLSRILDIISYVLSHWKLFLKIAIVVLLLKKLDTIVTDVRKHYEAINKELKARAFMETAIGVVALAAAIWIVAMTFKDLAETFGTDTEHGWLEKIAPGLVAIGAVILAMVVLFRTVGKMNVDSANISGTVWGVAASVAAIWFVAKALIDLANNLDTGKGFKENMAKVAPAILAIMAIIGLLAGLFAVVGIMKPGTGTTWAIVAAMASVWVVAQAFKDLAKLKKSDIKKGTDAMKVVFIGIGALMAVSSLAKVDPKTMFGITASILAVAAALAALSYIGNTNPEGLEAAMDAMTHVILYLTLLVAATGLTQPAMGVLIALGVIVGLIAAVIVVLSKIVGVEDTVAITGSLSQLFQSITILMAVIGLVGKFAMGGLIKGLLGMLAIFGVIGLVIYGLGALIENNVIDENTMNKGIETFNKVIDAACKMITGVFKAIGQALFGDKTPIQMLSDDLAYMAEVLGSEEFKSNFEAIGSIQFSPGLIANLVGLLLVEAVMAVVGFLVGLLSVPTQIEDRKSAVQQVVDDLSYMASILGGDKFKTDFENIAKLEFSPELIANLTGLLILEAITAVVGFLVGLLSIPTQIEDRKSAVQQVVDDLAYFAEVLGGEKFKTDFENIAKIKISPRLIATVSGLVLLDAITAAVGFLSGLASVTYTGGENDEHKSAVGQVVNDLAYFAEVLGGEEFKKNFEAIGNIDIDPETLANLAAFETLEFVTSINGFISGISSLATKFATGRTSAETFVADLQLVADALSDQTFQNNLEAIGGINVPTAEIQALSEALKTVSLQGFIDAIIDFFTIGEETPVEQFKTDAKDLGDALVAWAIAMTRVKLAGGFSVPSEDIEKLKESIDLVSKDGGLMGAISSFFTGDKGENLANFKTHAEDLGAAIAAFTGGLSGTNLAKLSQGAIAADRLASIMEYVSEISATDQYVVEFDEALGRVGTALNSFATEIVDSELVMGVGVAASDFISAVHTLVDFKFDGDVMSDSIITTFNNNLGSIFKSIVGLNDQDFSGADRFVGAINSIASADVEGFIEKTSGGAGDAGKETGDAAGKETTDSMASTIESGAGAVASAVSTVMSDAFEGTDKIGYTAGFDLVSEIAKGIRGNSSVDSAINSLLSGASSSAEGHYSSFYNAGSSMGTGFKEGILSQMLYVKAAAEAIAMEAVRRAKEVIRSASPSKVMIEVGEFFGEGFAIGILSEVGHVSDSAAELGKGALDGMTSAINSINEAIDSDINTQPTIRPVLDLSEIQNGASSLGSMLDGVGSVSLYGNITAIDGIVAQRRQSASLDDVVMALGNVERSASNIHGGDTYNVNGITYDDGSNISDAIRILAHEVLMDRRR